MELLHNEYEDLITSLDEEVTTAYYAVYEELEPLEIAPDLLEVYETFYAAILDNIFDVYDEVFGSDENIRKDWLADIGVDPDGIPNILMVCRILNNLRFPYMFMGCLFNNVQSKLLVEEARIEEDVMH